MVPLWNGQGFFPKRVIGWLPAITAGSTWVISPIWLWEKAQQRHGGAPLNFATPVLQTANSFIHADLLSQLQNLSLISVTASLVHLY